MSQKHRKSKKRPRARLKGDQHPSQLPGEDRRSVSVTVGWMTSTLATAVALTLHAVAFLVTRAFPEDGHASPLAALPGLLLFIAVVTGTLSLLLLPLVYRLRPTPPPVAVTIGSVLIAAAPWVITVLRAGI